jgi:hypothetical protein
VLQVNALRVHPATIVLKAEHNSQQVFAMQAIIVLQDKLPLNQLLMFVQWAVIVKLVPANQLLADQATTIHLQE